METKCVSTFYAELNIKLISWPKSEEDFLPSFDSAVRPISHDRFRAIMERYF